MTERGPRRDYGPVAGNEDNSNNAESSIGSESSIDYHDDDNDDHKETGEGNEIESGREEEEREGRGEEESPAYQNQIQNAFDVLNRQESVKDQNDSSVGVELRNWYDSDPTLTSPKMINASDNPAINHLDSKAQARRDDCMKKEDQIPAVSFSTDFVSANEKIRNDNADIATKEVTHLRHDTDQIEPPPSKQKKKEPKSSRLPVEAVARQFAAIANAANVPIVYNKASSTAVNKAYSTAINEVVDERMEHHNHTGAAVTADQKHEWMVDQRRKSNFGWVRSRKNIFLKGKTLYELVRNRPVVLAVHKKNPNHQIPKNESKWWNKLIETVIKTKCMQKGKQTATSIPIGGVLSYFGKGNNAGAALISEQNRHGFYMLFGDLTSQVLEILEGCRTKGNTIPYDPTYGGYGDFDTEQAAELSLGRTTESLELLAKHYDTTVSAILDGLTVSDFIAKYKDDFTQLEVDAGIHTDNSVDVMAFDFADRDEVNHYKRNKRNVIFCALANILVCYHDIIKGLINKNICIVVDNKERLHFMAKIDEAMKVEYCIGSRIRRGINPNEIEGQVITDGYYMIELYTIAEEEKDFLFIDTNSKKNINSTVTQDLPYKAIPLLDSTSRTIRLCKITRKISESLTTWDCTMRDLDKQKHPKNISVHRLVNIVANHNGLGINNYTPLRRHLQLQVSETIISNERFHYHDFTNERSARLVKRRSNKLQQKEWQEVKLATICDIDHMIGRSKLWMNSNFFTWMVSHQYNTQLSYVRIFFGDWLYGFSGEIEYRSGND